MPVAGHQETWKVQSRDFKLWVLQVLYNNLGAAPKAPTIDMPEVVAGVVQ